MTPNAVLVQVPSIDFGTFLGLSQQALGYSPADEVDANPLERSDAEKFLTCLAALREQHAAIGFLPSLLGHVSFSILAAADDRDMLDILQAASGMHFVVADTLHRGVQLAVITGTLAQWRDAVATGSARDTEFNVRAFFNRVMTLFEAAGLNVWRDFDHHTLPDRTYYLEDKRKR